MKRRIVAIVMVVGLLVLTSSIASAEGGPGGTWTSWPFLQNLENATANCVINFHREGATGPAPVHTVSITIPANGSTFVPVYAYDVLGTFSGSMVVSCDRRVVAVTNVVNHLGAGSSYVGAESGANRVSIPSVHADDYGWFTEVSVQNAGSAPATVTIAFVASVRGANYTPPAVTIQPGAVHRFNTYDFRAQMDNVPGIEGFVGGATVTSVGSPVVAVAREWNSGGGYMTITYNGIPEGDGGTVVYFPSQHNNNYGWYTWNYVFNSWTSPANVNIQFTGKPVRTAVVPAGGSLLIDTMTYLGTEDYVGALTVTCTNCPPGSKYLSGISNEVQVGAGLFGALSYNAFYTGTTGILFPSQHNNNWGWNAFNFIQNLSDFPATVRVEWIRDPASPSAAPAPFTATIPANGSLQLHTYMYHGANDFIGALRVTSTNGALIVGICNENNARAPGLDATISYNSIAQ